MSDKFDRRSFFKVLAPAFSIACAAKNAYSTKFAEREKLSKIGLQLCTVRKELERDFAQTLAQVAMIGYKEVEFAGYFNNSPNEIKKLLAANNLSAPSAHISLKNIRENLGAALESALIIGHKYLICGHLPAEERKTVDDYKKLAELFNHAGEKCKRNGIQFGYHNHDFEFSAVDNAIPYDVLLKETDANLVKMELDLYWIAKAERNPLEYFAKNPKRFALLHVKDMDATPKKNFTEVGRGVINFREIFTQAKKAGIKHHFVEQDKTPASPFESAKISYDFLRNLNF